MLFGIAIKIVDIRYGCSLKWVMICVVACYNIQIVDYKQSGPGPKLTG
jgi:hypothetical protein